MTPSKADIHWFRRYAHGNRYRLKANWIKRFRELGWIGVRKGEFFGFHTTTWFITRLGKQQLPKESQR